MTTPRRWGAFTEADVSSAIKGAIEAGLHIVSARISLAGDIELLTAEAPQPEEAAPAGEAQAGRRVSVRSASRRMACASDPLYQTEEDLRGWVAPHLPRPAFARLIIQFEHYGFPKFDPVLKGRYAPAVKAWLDDHARVSMVRFKSDGGEDALWGRRKGHAPSEQAEKPRPVSKILLERRNPSRQDAPPEEK